MNEAAGLASWWAYVIRYEARELWRSLPGPWDELAVIALTAAFRKRRARRTAQIQA